MSREAIFDNNGGALLTDPPFFAGVEQTIGDSYVAVCGLPEPNPTHHVVMARFARDCMASIELSTRSLVDELGSDTAELSLRIGLHSGPVTAGVLRGRRARFQL